MHTIRFAIIVIRLSVIPLPVVLLSFGCGSGGKPASSNPASAGRIPLDTNGITALIPARYKDRAAWSEAILNALTANDIFPDRESACAVIAVIAQESGFAADPVVPGMAALAAGRIDRYQSKLGPVGKPLFKRLLSGRAPDAGSDGRTFEKRLATVRTERDVDVLFRDLLAYYQNHYPALFTAVNWAGRLADLQSLAELNPITTAGSMQVSVRFAEEWAATRQVKEATAASVRDSLYTRNGGVYYGTARLLVYPARYDDAIFRFADYNAGLYASRNAAVQTQLSRLTGQKLVLDGDLLSYEKDGRPRDQEGESERAMQTFGQRFAPSLTSRKIRRDLRTEKTLAFEDSETYLTLKRFAEERLAGPSEYAVLPQVAISSPKFARTRSTAWFAQSVDRRYHTCLGVEAVGASPAATP